jgi:hypothetical protein
VLKLVADQFAEIDRLRFKLQRRSRFWRDYIANIGEHRSVPGQVNRISQ